MRAILFLMLCYGVIPHAMSQMQMPPSIVAGFTQSRLGESGGLFVKGVDQDEFTSYITHNWKSIIENLDTLPVTNAKFLDDSGPRNYAISIFGAACEWLPPQEYVDFLEKWVALSEKGEIPYQALHDAVVGVSKKNYFVAANWEDPRIKAILRRVIAATPDEEKDAKIMYRECLSGRLADNYMVNKEDDTPPPETLPGIKLKAPFENQLARVKQLRSRKDASNPRREGTSNIRSDSQRLQSTFGWPLVLILIIVGGGIGYVLFRKLKPRISLLSKREL